MNQPKPVAEEVGPRKLERRVLLHGRFNLRRDQLAERRRLDETLGSDAAAVEHEAHPLRHVADARPHGAGRCDGVGRAHRHDPNAVVDRVVRYGDVRLAADLRHQRLGLVHTERPENPRTNERFPRHSGRALDDRSAQRVHHVLIRPVRPERRLRLDVPQPVNDLRHRVVPSCPEEVRTGQPATVREQIADGELARRVRIGELKLGDVVGDVIVPAQLAVVDEHGERGRRHRLRRRSDRKTRVLVGRADSCRSRGRRSPWQRRASRPSRPRSRAPALSNRGRPAPT